VPVAAHPIKGSAPSVSAPACIVNGRLITLPASCSRAGGRLFKSGLSSPDEHGALPIADLVLLATHAGMSARQISDTFGLDFHNVTGKLNNTQGAKSSERNRLYRFKRGRFYLTEAGLERLSSVFG